MVNWDKIKELTDQHGYMSGIDRMSDRVKETAEVFTPTDIVIKMICDTGIENFSSGKKILDPACGDGQFLVTVKWLKVIHFKMSESDALKDIYGVELMKDNVNLCKERLAGNDKKLRKIVDQNIICANSLEYSYKFDGSDPSVSEKEKLFNALFDTE